MKKKEIIKEQYKLTERFTIEKIKGEKVIKGKDTAIIEGKRRRISVRISGHGSWPSASTVILDSTQLHGEADVVINYSFHEDEHIFIVRVVTLGYEKESILTLKKMPIVNIEIDAKAKIICRTKVGEVDFEIAASRDERIELRQLDNKVNFFNGFRQIIVDLEKKLHVEVNADQIIDNIKI